MLVLLSSMLPRPTSASCVFGEQHIVRVEVVRCRDARASVAAAYRADRERLGMTVQRGEERRFARNVRGLRLTVEIHQQRAVTLDGDEPRFSQWTETEREVEAFAPIFESCEDLKLVQPLWLGPPCCDTLPASEPACLLGVDLLRPIPRWLDPKGQE